MTPPMKEPDLALAGVALLVMFGLLMWHDSPIKRSHLLDPYVQHQDPSITGDSYKSWLWQDPFEFNLDSYLKRDQYVIEDLDGKAEEASHRRYWAHKKIEQKEGPESQCESGKIAKKNHVTILAPLLKVQPNTLENKDIRTRYRYAVIAGLMESGYRPVKPNRLHFFSRVC